MRHYIRSSTPGASYFFTVTLQDRSARWLVDQVEVLRLCVRKVQARHPFNIDAMVVLPEHLHAVWTLPDGDANYAARWMLVKQGFTRCLGAAGELSESAAWLRGAKAEGTVWQRRYWEHQIRDDDDFARHVDYIHYNPVKHGLVSRAADWPYSSFHRFVHKGVLTADWGVGSGEEEGEFGERA